MRLIKISDGILGLVADMALDHAFINTDRFLAESEFYHVPHNTNFSAFVHILQQGHFGPSKRNKDDIKWLPSPPFYARGSLAHFS